MKFTTFVNQKENIQPLIEAGVRHLILEDPKVSIRCFASSVEPGFTIISDMIAIARSIEPDIKLSINCDMMAHESHFPLLTELANYIKSDPTLCIRLQDPGLLRFFRDILPEHPLHLNLETGNHSITSMQAFARYATSQTVSNEVPATTLGAIRNEIKTPLEILVFGPLLIQYSPRRFLHGAPDIKSDLSAENRYIKYAQDTQFPGRTFKFFDNAHGHFMYAFFDRCLLNAYDSLQNLKMDDWLFDGRGESLDYIQTAIGCFRDYNENAFSQLQAKVPRPLKLGFFRANHTDQVHISKPHMRHNTKEWVGTVVDILKGEAIVIECLSSVSVGTAVSIITPKQTEITTTIHRMFSLSKNQLITVTPDTHCYFTIPWEKGVLNGSRIYRNTTEIPFEQKTSEMLP
jgi:collagenase-like PrtC family protease